MEVDADDTGVLLHLFPVNAASLRYEEEKLLRVWVYFSKAQPCHLTVEYENASSNLTMSRKCGRIKDQSS